MMRTSPRTSTQPTSSPTCSLAHGASSCSKRTPTNPRQEATHDRTDDDTSKDIMAMFASLELSPPLQANDSIVYADTDSWQTVSDVANNLTGDHDIEVRPLNTNELSLWNSLTTSSPSALSIPPSTSTASSPTSQTPTSRSVSKSLLKKNKTTNDPNDKRDFLFGGLPPELRIQMQLDDVAQYSVTDMKTAARISHFISALPGLSPDSIVTDSTACVGGNTASFCTFFRYVQAVEIDATRFQMLVHNLHAVMSLVNVQCYCANYVDVVECFSQDVVFVDPPWGGPEYRSRCTVDLFLGNTPLADVCERLVGRTQYVVVKVPENFDLDKFTANVSGVVGYISSFRKMGLVVVDYRYVQPTPVAPGDAEDSIASKFYS